MQFRHISDEETSVQGPYFSRSVCVIFTPPSSLFQEDRRLSSATISNHASSLLYPLKYYHRANAPRFTEVPIILQLRKMATVLQKQGDLERTSTREDLQALNKWLDWWVYRLLIIGAFFSISPVA